MSEEARSNPETREDLLRAIRDWLWMGVLTEDDLLEQIEFIKNNPLPF